MLNKAQAERPPRELQTTLGGRVAVGCIVALGLHLGLREWLKAGTNSVECTPAVLFALGVALRLVGSCLGGLLAGAGRENPFSGGLAVGVVSAFAWFVIDPYPDVKLDLIHLGMAALIVFLPGCAAVVGGRRWPAAIELPAPEDSRGSSLLKFLPHGPAKDNRRPTQWWKILVSVGLVLTAIATADSARTSLKKLPPGLLNNFGSSAATSRTDFEISVVGVLLGALIAGVSTGAGTRHGLISGVIMASAVWGMYRIGGEETYPALDFIIDHLEIKTPINIVLCLGGIFFLVGTVGGWLGGQLLPPLRKKVRLGQIV